MALLLMRQYFGQEVLPLDPLPFTLRVKPPSKNKNRIK